MASLLGAPSLTTASGRLSIRKYRHKPGGPVGQSVTNHYHNIRACCTEVREEINEEMLDQ